MTLETAIINDLTVSQTTAHALAERLGKKLSAVAATLSRMETDGRVKQRPICEGRLIVWYPARAQKEAAQ